METNYLIWQTIPVHSKLNVIRFKQFDTIRIVDGKQIQTDNDFLQDISKIVSVRQDLFSNIMSYKKKNQFITDQQCNEIDYKARLHYEANRLNSNTGKKTEDIDEYLRCKCGCEKSKGSSISLCSNEQKLELLGPGVVLHFMYLKGILLNLVLFFLIYGIYALVTNIIGTTFGQNQECTGIVCHIKQFVSIENKYKANQSLEIQVWLGAIVCFIWIIISRLIKYYGKHKNKKIDSKLLSASDFALKVGNLPAGQYTQQQLLQYFDKLHGRLNEQQQNRSENTQTETQNKFDMKSIQIIYNMQFSRILIEQIFTQCQKLYQLLGKHENGQKILIKNVYKYRSTKFKLKNTYHLLRDLRKKFLHDSEFRRSISTTECLLQFKTQKKKNIVFENFGQEHIGIIKQVQNQIKRCLFPKSKVLYFKGHMLKLQRAPQPSDILWQNCEKKFSRYRILLIYGVTFLIVLISFGVYSSLDFLQDSISKTQSEISSIDTIVVIIMALALQGVNQFIWFISFYLLKLEYNHTLTDMIVSQMNKALFSMTNNIIILPIISLYVIKQQLFGTGLSGSVLDYQLSYLAVAAIKIIDPVNMIKRILLKFSVTRNIIIRWKCSKIPSEELDDYIKCGGIYQVNKLYEGSNFDIAENYVVVLSIIYHAVFFCYLQPIALFFVCITVLVSFWANKILLFRTCKIPQITDSLIFQTALTQSSFVPIMFGIGTLILEHIHQLQNDQIPVFYAAPIICILIGLIDFTNPGNFLNIIVDELANCLFHSRIFRKKKKVKKENREDTNLQQQGNSGIELRVKNPLTLEIPQNIQMSDLKKQQPQFSNDDNYYQQSNSLALLGFQSILKGDTNFEIVIELKKYCQSFFPNKQVQLNENEAIKLLIQFQKSKKSILDQSRKKKNLFTAFLGRVSINKLEKY